MGKSEYFEFFERIVEVIRNLIIPLDSARRVVLGTSMEQLEHVPERIRERITRIW